VVHLLLTQVAGEEEPVTIVTFLKHLALVELGVAEMVEVHQEHQPHNQEL
jgi:hypothetical protein